MAEAPEHQLPNSKGSNLDSTVRETQLVPSPFTNTGLKDVVIFFDDSKEKLARVEDLTSSQSALPRNPPPFPSRLLLTTYQTKISQYEEKKKAYIIFLQPS